LVRRQVEPWLYQEEHQEELQEELQEDIETSGDDEPVGRPRRQRRRRFRDTGPVLPDDVLARSHENAARSPDFFCNICCRVLFRDEALAIKIPHNVNTNEVSWPCLQYNRNPSRNENGELVACSSHRVWNNKSQATIRFINAHWGNPLRHQNEQGQWVVEPEIPAELSELSWTDLPYVCPIMTHSSIGQRGGTRLCFPHVDGRVSIYSSEKYLSRYDGLMSLSLDSTIPEANCRRIIAARQWLAANNPLFPMIQPIPVPEQEGVIGEGHERTNPEGMDQNLRYFTTTLLQQPEPGPEAANVRFEDLNIGMDMDTEEVVSYQNADLMAKLFPNLFPYGEGVFALWHHKKELRDPAHTGLPVMTIKDYAKYRLLHFDRHVGTDNRLLCFLFDWIVKNATFGFRSASVNAPRPLLKKCVHPWRKSCLSEHLLVFSAAFSNAARAWSLSPAFQTTLL